MNTGVCSVSSRRRQIYRAVLEMKLLMGCSDGEIAAKLGLSKAADPGEPWPPTSA